MAIDLGKIMVVPRGTYAEEETYERLDLVEFEGSNYIAIKAVKGVTPSNDGVYWQLHGAAGKTAYEYAQIAGYEGTEEEFGIYQAAVANSTEDIAQLKAALKDFIITVTESGSGGDKYLVADKTYSEITQALSAGKKCFVLYKDRVYNYSNDELFECYIFKNIDTEDPDSDGKSSITSRKILIYDLSTRNVDYAEEEISSNGNDNQIEIVQEPGNNEEFVMSQKAVTELVKNATNGNFTHYETVDSVDQMKNTNTKYILSTTGTVWEYKEVATEVIVEKTEKIVSTEDNPAKDGYTMGTTGESANASYTISPYIDLHKYGFPCTLELNGLQWVTATPTGKIRVQTYDETKTLILQYSTALSGSGYWPYAATGNVKIIDETHATVDFPEAYIINSSKTVRYLRFGAEGKWADADISVIYKGTEIEMGNPTWVDTGVVAGDIAEFCLANPSVKDYMDFADYYPFGDDYSQTYVDSFAGYDYFRKDLPLPVVLKWNIDTMAAEYVVAIGTESNMSALKAQKYYTTENKIAIYNLIPNKTYYYKVYSLGVNGSKTLVKESSFSTTSDITRMLKVDGIQNVRDIGGYGGKDGKTVKYGLLYRGSAMDEEASRHLYLTDEGRKEMTERLGVKTDIDLRYGYTKTVLNSNAEKSGTVTPDVEFVNTSSGYENYASAFTVKSQRTNFANLLSSIVTSLSKGAVYFHCQGGCDRTGTLAFLLLGLLGVSESDLAKEYELSSFSSIGYTRTRNSTKYIGMIEKVKAYSGNTIADKVYSFATKANDDTETGGCGISADTITSFRNLMLN